MSEKLTKIRERLLEKMYEEINKQRLLNNLSVLTDEEKQAIDGEVSHSILCRKEFSTTSVSDTEYSSIEHWAVENMQKTENQDIISRFAKWLFGKQ